MSNLNSSISLEQLKNRYLKCNKCSELCSSRTQVVFGTGKENSKILLVGEAPGANEDKEGIPFCGMSGQILNQLLSSNKINREEVFITNTILCRPKDNRQPTKEEVENCRERLDQLIGIIQPKVIVTIGNFATERILNKTGIKSIRGKIFQIIINNKEVKVVPVIHPANYLYSGRNPEIFRQMQKDFLTITQIITEEKKQKSITEF